MPVTIRRAVPGDLDFIMATERGPGFERFLGQWVAGAHRAEMANEGSAYLIGERNGEANGFAMFQALDEPFGNVHLRRVAVREPGTGFGRPFVCAVVGFAFTLPNTHRLFLNVLAHNERARHVYREAGFTEEGLQREAHLLPDGTRCAVALMSILRPEWERR